MIWIVAAIAASVVAGAWAERRNPERAGTASRRGLMVVLFFVLPPIEFLNLAHATLDAGLAIGLGLGILTVIVVGITAWALAVKVLDLDRPRAGAVICSTLVPNTGYLGYPLVLTLMGSRALGQAVVFDVIVAGTALLIGAFAVGAAFGNRAGERPSERIRSFFLRNPSLYAATAGLLAPHSLAPDLLVDISRIAVMAILPVGFFAVGAVLAEEERAGTIRLPPRLHRPVGVVILAKIVLSPALLLILAIPFSGIPGSYFLMAAMPTGLNSMIVAHAYGLDLRTTAESIVYTTAIVVVAIAAWTVIA